MYRYRYRWGEISPSCEKGSVYLVLNVSPDSQIGSENHIHTCCDSNEIQKASSICKMKRVMI